MCRDRFQAILWSFYFGDNDETYNNKLGKIKYLVDYLNDTMKDVYVPEDRSSLNKSLMLCSGRLIFFQYIKNKRYKYGIKFFKIAQYDGIIFWVSVYLWHSYNNDKNLGQTDATVLQLAHYFLDKGNLLFVDNRDNSS